MEAGSPASSSRDETIRIPTFAREFYQPGHGLRPLAQDFPSQEDRPPPVYALSHLPPPVLVSKILDCFYTCSGTLFYICTREESFELFRSLYWGDGAVRTTLALAELCAIAAVGSQYDTDLVSVEHRRAFFDTAKICIDDVVETSELRAMRLYALCGMFSVMDKRIAAWTYVGMCFQTDIRWLFPPSFPSPTPPPLLPLSHPSPPPPPLIPLSPLARLTQCICLSRRIADSANTRVAQEGGLRKKIS